MLGNVRDKRTGGMAWRREGRRMARLNRARTALQDIALERQKMMLLTGITAHCEMWPPRAW